MTDYVKSTNFASKDALSTGNPSKIVKGTEIDTEFTNIATAVATKADLLSPVFSGTPTAPTAATGTSTTQLATTAFATAAVSAFTGAMMMWPTATAPSGFLLCNGQAVSRTTYAALFAVLGVVFGSGDGSTTFTLPDYRDRSPIGAGTAYSANSKGGSADAIVVSHAHTAVAAGSHQHFIASNETVAESGSVTSSTSVAKIATQGGSTNQSYELRPGTVAATVGLTSSVADHNHTINSTGSSGTGANLSPYIGVYFIIKT